VSQVIPLEPLAAAIKQTVDVLAAGEVAVVPTDTVYGIVADAFNATATSKMFGFLRRGRDVPLPVLIRSPRQVVGLVDDVAEAADRLMASYWPGPLTLVLPVADGLTWDLGDTTETVSLRMPADDLLLGVIAEVGPLACTSAPSLSGGPAGLEELQRQFGDAVALYVDGGPRERPTSTIVDVSRGHAEVLREGAIPTDDVMAVAEGRVGWGERPQREPVPAPSSTPPPTQDSPPAPAPTQSSPQGADPAADAAPGEDGDDTGGA